jgi:hypothetical protein
VPSIEYYKRPDGSEPAREWIKAQDNSIRPDINAKIKVLEENGLRLVGTRSLDIIAGEDHGFFELRNITFNWRIGFYHDRERDVFVFLHGWKHTKKYKKEIEKARELLHEYLRLKKERYG